VADVPLTHGEYDGTYYSTGSAPLGDDNTVQLVYTETRDGALDVIGRLDGALATLGLQIPAKPTKPVRINPIRLASSRRQLWRDIRRPT
jgi:hypothetical protein